MTNTYKPLTLKLAWNLAAPRSWVASVIPAVFGILFCSIQGYQLSAWQGICLFLACVFLQSSVNTLNDYMDFIKGTDGEDDNVEENDAVLIYGGIAPKSALKLGIVYLVIGIFLGVVSCLSHGYYPMIIGTIGVLVIAFYSCGPHPISYLPVGELISGGVMGGLIPLGICACADGKLHFTAIFGSLPLIIGIALIMLCNNGCDIEKDILAGRKTFPVVVGRKRANQIYHGAILLWVALLIMEPILLIGKIGILCPILLFILARKPMSKLWSLQLEPSHRIVQMQTIAASNLMGNGAYCITFLCFCIIKIIHG
ncbi:MAG: prenyltransferase [Eubacteriales bacterium]|nr:prenyltransferase [Eubacteriales bacterium]